MYHLNKVTLVSKDEILRAKALRMTNNILRESEGFFYAKDEILRAKALRMTATLPTE
jgi:hypothetical protein